MNSKGSVHEQIRGRGFEALNTKSTWSSFDDITWDDFCGEDDHSVPDPEEPASQPLWLRGGRRRDSSRSRALSKEEAAAAGKMEDEASMDVVDWEVAELGTVPDNLFEEDGLIGGELKQESPDALLASGLCLDEQVFNEEDASIVTSSGGFSYVPTEEEMGLFGGESDVDKGGTLLGYAWDNLEDMGSLFQNEDAFGQDATDALIQWPSSSSSPESAAALNAKDSSELRAMKGKSHDQDMKMEFIPCETFEKSSAELCASNSENTDVCANNSELLDTEMDVAAEPGYSVNREKFPAEDPLKPVVSSKPKLGGDILTDKTPRRQTANRKRCEDRTKKQIYPKKLIIQQKQQHQPLTHYSSALVKPSVASSLQVYPAMPPPILGANSAMPHRPRSHSFLHSSMAASSYLQQHPQPVMMCYEHADVHQQRQQQQQQEARQKLEILTPSPVSGTNMTPQEKIEKLRWKQKMQRLASEQQQQITKQCITLDSSAKQSVQKKIHGKQLVVNKSDEAEGRIVEAAVLNQLLTIMSKLNVGTRICIRDALYRLAKSAVSRNATDGASSSECSHNSAAEKSLSRSIRYPVLETETNPIDRTIANLLFHKRNAGTVLAVSSLPATTNWNSWQQAETMCEETQGTYGKGCFGEDQSTDDVLSGEGEVVGGGDGESEGSSRRPLKMDMNSSLSRACEVKAPRSGLKREASCEFLSRGKGTSIVSDSAKAAKTV